MGKVCSRPTTIITIVIGAVYGTLLMTGSVFIGYTMGELEAKTAPRSIVVYPDDSIVSKQRWLDHFSHYYEDYPDKPAPDAVININKHLAKRGWRGYFIDRKGEF